MFIQIGEMQDMMYNYQLQQITEDNDTIITNAINTAVEEVKSYLTTNDRREWQDGRVVYDVVAIFAATGNDRHPLILAHVKTCTEWWIIQLCNADIIYEKVKDRYDRSIDYLKKIAKGEITINGLPKIDTSLLDENGNPITQLPFRMGGRQKFTHE